MNGVIAQVAIRAITATVPRNTVDLRDLGDLWGPQELRRVTQATGITKVRIAPATMMTSDLCEDAARRLMTRLQLPPESVDAIVFVTQTPDFIVPSTSTLLQSRLGLPESTITFDLNGGCCGYIYGLLQAALLVNAGMCGRVMVLAGDTISKLLAPKDRGVRAVFGDGGSATLVERQVDCSSAFAIRSDGGSASALIVPAGGFRTPRSDSTAVEHVTHDGNSRSADHLYMDGTGVMTFALKVVPEIIEEVIRLVSWQTSGPTLCMLHQANRLMIEVLRRKLRMGERTVPFVCGETGNTGPASIPLALTLASQALHAEKMLERTVLCGFGAGLSWGAVATNLSHTHFVGLGEL